VLTGDLRVGGVGAGADEGSSPDRHHIVTEP
jgi:hypothetical protein